MRGLKVLKRVMSAVLVIVMLFTMVGVYIPAETFKAATPNYATVVGTFDKLSSYNSTVTANWNPSDTNGKMESLGMKYHYKHVTFDELTSNIAMEFKVAFNGGWDWSIGNGSDNFKATFSKGTTQFKVLTDETNVWYSIGTDKTVDDKLAGIYVNLAGDFPSKLGNCSITEAWSNTSSGTPRMEHLGNGFYYKKITFNKTTSQVEVAYKVTCNGTWDGINDGGNDIKFKIPAGTSEITYIADMNNYVLYNSIDHPQKIEELLGGGASGDKNYNYTIYIQDDWDAAKSEIHAWSNSGENAKDLSLSDGGTFKGTKWLKAELKDAKATIGFLIKSKGSWNWQTSDIKHTNTTDKDQTLYYINGTLYTDLNKVPDLSQGTYLFVEYGGEPSAGKSVYSWANGYSESGFFVPFKETEDGTYIAKVPVKLDGTNDRKLGFLVNGQPRWPNDGANWKEGGDLYCTVSASAGYGKVVFSGGNIVKESTAFKSSEIHRKNGYIAFNFRDNESFALKGVGYLGADADVKVNVIKVNEAGTSAAATYDMTYSRAISGYTYELPLTDDTDYYYYFTVNGAKVEDNNTTRKAELDGTTYSYNRNKVYNVTVGANLYYSNMDYDQSNLICISYGPKTAQDSMDGFKLEHVYLDLSELGLGSRVEISKDLLTTENGNNEIRVTFGCADTVEPGEKTVKVTLVDDCDGEYVGYVTVNVVERIKGNDFDWDEAIIYFAVTDRFYDGNTSNNNVTNGYNKNNALGIHGGDFAGLTAKLDYLQDLGVNTIWITPIVDNIDYAVGSNNYAYHGYWAEDFESLNPHLGTEAEFVTLLEEVHNRGMKLMVDVVLNHSGYDTEGIFNNKLDSGYRDPDGKFVFDDMIRAESIDNDEEKMSLSGLPDFMTEDPEVRALLIAWQTSWINKYSEQIDYFRVDTVKHVDDATWVEFKNEITKINSRFKLIGEYFDAGFKNDYNQLGTGMMDSILDFHFNDILASVSQENLAAIEEALQERNASLNNVEMMGSFLSSHDENGFLYTLIQNEKNQNADWAKNQMKVAVTYQMTAKGQPVIYYGEEIGMTAAEANQANRYDFNWSQATDSNAMLKHYKTMIAIRNAYSEVFAKGDRYSVVIPDAQSDRYGTKVNAGYEVFARSYKGETVYVGTNIFGDAKQVTFYVEGAPGSTYTNLYDEKTYTVSAQGTITVSIPGAANGGTVVLAKTAGETAEIEDDNKVTVVIHYKRSDNKYTNWNAWLWGDTLGGAQYDFENVNGEMVTEVTLDGRTNTKLNFRIRYGEWKDNDHDGKDQSIDISNIVSGTVHYYIESGVWGGTMKLGGDAIVGNKIVKTSYDRITNTFTITTARPISGAAESAFDITCTTDNKALTILDVTGNGSVYTVAVEEDLSSMKEVLKAYAVEFDDFVYSIAMPNIYSTKEFEDAYTYEGKDLGLTYTANKSTFKVWAPTADKVVLNVYASGTKGTDDKLGAYEMTLGEKGVWSYELNGDWNGKYYTYSVSVNNETNEVCDPYARTTGVNGNRAMILDLDSTDPEGWAEDKNKMPNNGMSYTDAIIYELHVRDLSSDDSSGISEEHQGKFLGLTETGTKTPGGHITGLDHIVNLGVTHVHLLPVYDYASVDETRLDEPQFNWGYDPLNYNVPEGSYSTNPYDGASRVSEMKQMVKALHDNNINVIMDVVYNHVYDAGTFGFNQIVPSYFSRTNADGTFSNGSGCGNDTATERSMVHKYVVESILYWHEEYHIDGFRFDLVGLLDTETINTIVEEVHAIDPDIIFYGEGWTLGTAVSKDGYHMATQANAHLTPGFAYFSDTLRDGLAGNNTNGTGLIWVNGNVDTLKYAFAGNSSWCPEPTQTINYASCHDNYTLMDKINEVSNAPYDSYDDAPGTLQVKLNNLSAAYYMFAQGIPFIHAGEEFLRTKLDTDGTVIHNSYNASDYVNTLRWYNLDGDTGNYKLYADTVEYYKGLIEFRKNHEALRLTTDEKVAEVMTTFTYENYLYAYKLDGRKVEGEVADEIIIIYNASNDARGVDIINDLGASTGTWKVCVNAEDAGTDVLKTITVNANSSWPTVDAHSVLVLVKGETVDNDSVYTRNNNVAISLNKTKLEVKENETATLTATVNPSNSTLTWSSSDSDVVTVDEDGKITAVAAGTATITVTTLHGEHASCEVSVGHALTEVEGKDATCTEDGYEDHYVCDACDKLFADASAEEEIKLEDITIEALGHELTKIEAKAPTNTEAGNVEHYVCELCDKLFTDAEGKQETTKEAVTLAPLGHVLTKVEAKEPTCTKEGHEVYYTCSHCDKLFADASAEEEITLEDITIEALGHELTKIEAKAPTTEATGNIEYYVCEVCHNLFSDAEGKQETTLEDVTLDKLQPEKPPVNPPVIPPVKEDVVYVPETEVEEQVSGEADKLVEKLENQDDLKDVVSDETLENVQNALDNNGQIVTELVIENKEDVEVEESAKELVEEAVKDMEETGISEIVQYIDIKVVLKEEVSGAELGTLNKLSEEITLTFTIPEELKKEGRIFNIIRVHNDKTDVLDVWENEDGTLSFKTDRFSTYALIYTDVVEDGGVTPQPPVTGDSSQTGLYLAILFAGLVVLMAGVANKRKYTK